MATGFDVSDEDEATIYGAMSSDDALHVVLSGAIYIEHQLDALISEHSKSKEAIKRLNLDFDAKLDVALVLGLTPRLRGPIAALAKIRNTFAHTLGAKLTSDSVGTVYNALHSDDKQRLQQIYIRARTNNSRPKQFSALPPLEKFVLLALTLRGALLVARSQGGNAALIQEQTSSDPQPSLG